METVQECSACGEPVTRMFQITGEAGEIGEGVLVTVAKRQMEKAQSTTSEAARVRDLKTRGAMVCFGCGKGVLATARARKQPSGSRREVALSETEVRDEVHEMRRKVAEGEGMWGEGDYNGKQAAHRGNTTGVHGASALIGSVRRTKTGCNMTILGVSPSKVQGKLTVTLLAAKGVKKRLHLEEAVVRAEAEHVRTEIRARATAEKEKACMEEATAFLGRCEPDLGPVPPAMIRALGRGGRDQAPLTKKEAEFERAATAADRAEEMYKGAWQAIVDSHTIHEEGRMERKESAAKEAAGKAAEAFTQAAEAARIAREEQEEMGMIEAEAAGGAAEVTGAQRTAEVEQGTATEAADAEERVRRDRTRKERRQQRRHAAMKLAMANGDG